MTPAGDVDLGNGLVTVRLRDTARSPMLVRRLRDFCAPCFTAVDPVREPDLTIAFEPFGAFPAAARGRCTAPVWFRRSSAPAFNLAGFRGELDAHRIAAFDDASRTAFVVDRAARAVRFFGEDGAAPSFVHLIELFRHAALLAAEAAGAVLLHGGGVLVENRLRVVVGAKGAGKTTTLLRLVAAGGAYFSGDKLLLRRDGDGLVVHAWPDYPNVGMGTLRGHPALARACDCSFAFADGTPKPDTHKELLDPAAFRAAVPQAPVGAARDVESVLFPRIGAPEPFAPVAPRDAALLVPFVEYPHAFEAVRWHGLFADAAFPGPDAAAGVLALLARVPWSGQAPLPAPAAATAADR